ncbi:DUF2971 domain-containing protein [Propionivibrio sp.]|uniref:DUF2971 domain-containing protein n=1 Tax=Propionivibrio sp. TaxID=2212460 RepID=UPI003BF200DF
MTLDFAALDTALEKTSSTLAGSRKHVQATPPEFLFHYTNSAGMRGILESSRLWATNYRFLNDASEVAYGMALFNSIVQDLLASSSNEVVSEFLGRTLHTANAFDGMFDCYIACFCERDDLLNQWRVYAGTGGGYALGLKAKEIGRRWGEVHSTQNFLLRKVIYNEDIQKRLISEVLELTVQILDEATQDISVADANNLIARCCHFVRSEVADYLFCFKHSAFAVEEEWRLCHIVSPGEEDHVQFRDGPYGLTPYVCLDPSPMAGVNNNKLPLARITHGPVPDPSNVRFALNKLLRAKEYAFVEIAGSVLPVRVGL